jgi:hypothetical protein
LVGRAGSGYGGSSGGPYTDDGGGTTQQPVLVVVDPNQTLSATPGQGVGVFVQYQTGGHWNIWWTCDTGVTGEPCAFDNTVTVSTGTIVNLAGQALEGNDSATQNSPTSVESMTNTTTGIDGMTFDTPLVGTAKPVITLDVKLSGVEQKGFIFFVQDGKVNGGYAGNLTDPLMLEPSSP